MCFKCRLSRLPDLILQYHGATPGNRTIQVYPKDIGALGGHTRSVDRPKPLNDAFGSKGERSCTTIRQAPGGWQCRESASPKISRLVRMCSSQSIFGIGRSLHVAKGTANTMLRLNRLTVSPRAHQRGHGFRPDGELVAVETTHCSVHSPTRKVKSEKATAGHGRSGLCPVARGVLSGWWHARRMAHYLRSLGPVPKSSRATRATPAYASVGDARPPASGRATLKSAFPRLRSLFTSFGLTWGCVRSLDGAILIASRSFG